MMNFMSETMPRPDEHPVLVLLDEFQNLGKLENVTEMASTLGGNGVSMWFFVQSLKAIDQIYHQEGRRTLINAARVQIFFGAQKRTIFVSSEQVGETSEVQKDVTHTKATCSTLITRARTTARKCGGPSCGQMSSARSTKTRSYCRAANCRSSALEISISPRPARQTRIHPLPEFPESRVRKPFLLCMFQLRSYPLPTPPIVPTAAQLSLRPGSQSRIRRGATFAAKVGRAAPPSARRCGTAQWPRPVGSGNCSRLGKSPEALIDFSVLAARAAITTRIAPEKEAAVAAILNKARAFRAQAFDAEAFDRNLRVVEATLHDVVDGSNW